MKPDPPVDVQVSPHDVKHLVLQWSPPPTWTSLDIFPLKYQVLYQWENRGIPTSVKVRNISDATTERVATTEADTFQMWKLN